MKQKLTIPDQIKYMKEKGITFELMSELKAEQFITNNTYYFKVKAFAKNYKKNDDGLYRNLDFGHLVELSKIDMYLRRTVLGLSIHLEHALKVDLNAAFSKDDKEDGYNILTTIKLDLEKDLPPENSYTKELLQKYQKNFALWNIIELLSMGKMIKLYKEYMKDRVKVCSMLFGISHLRNAAAHSNCLINDFNIKTRVNTYMKNELYSYATDFTKEEINKYLDIRFVNDFSCLLFTFFKVVKSIGIKDKAREELKGLAKRIEKEIEMFDNYNFVKERLRFIIKLIRFFALEMKKSENNFKNSL